MKKNIFALLSAAIVMGTSANAHATLETKEAAPNSTYKGVMRIGHGCDGQATLRVRISIPDGVIVVKPMPKAGWELETIVTPYEKTYDFHGPRSEGVTEIIWTGELADDHYDEFTFRGRITDDYAAGDTIYFPTVQECADGENAWVEIPAEGADSHSVRRPAPRLNIIEGEHAHH